MGGGGVYGGGGGVWGGGGGGMRGANYIQNLKCPSLCSCSKVAACEDQRALEGHQRRLSAIWDWGLGIRVEGLEYPRSFMETPGISTAVDLFLI